MPFLCCLVSLSYNDLICQQMQREMSHHFNVSPFPFFTLDPWFTPVHVSMSCCCCIRTSVNSELKPGWVKNQLQNIFGTWQQDNRLAMKLFGSKKAFIREGFI